MQEAMFVLTNSITCDKDFDCIDLWIHTHSRDVTECLLNYFESVNDNCIEAKFEAAQKLIEYALYQIDFKTYYFEATAILEIFGDSDIFEYANATKNQI